MKTLLRRSAGLIFVLTLLVGAHTTLAQGFSATITLRENGQGRFQNSNGFDQTLAGYLAPDPGPGGLSSALTYDLLNPPGLTAGDLLLTDPTTLLSDLIRFNPAESTQSGTGALVFYSILGGSELADTGFPTSLYTNTFTLAENQLGPTTYTPLLGQPGYVAGAAGLVTYILYSDEIGSAVPDYANTGLLMVFSLIALFLFARVAGTNPLLILNRRQ